VGGRFTFGLGPIVTTKACPGDPGVIKRRRRPSGGFVTVFASVASGQVRGVLACGFGAIMTTEAVAGDARVLERRGRPG
jgi:hypothetical protein